MTTIQVVEELRSRGKFAYWGITSKQRFSEMLIRIEHGLCKPATVDRFFGKFLFYGDGVFWFDHAATTSAEQGQSGE